MSDCRRRRRARNILAIAASIAFSSSLAAQAPAPTAPAQPEAKRPAPPLFPRHRRGLYRNREGIDVIDATPQSPPLDIDDPGVPDPGAYEINFTTHADYAPRAQRFQLLSVDANYGVRPVIAGYALPSQIKVEFPIAATHETGEPLNAGLGAVTAGVKVNFYRDDNRGIALSVYPQVEFASPGGRGVEKGAAEKGATIILPLLVSREFHDFTVAVNGAVETPIHDPNRQVAAELGAALGRALTRKVAAMIELRSESSLDFRQDRLIYVNAGLIHGVRNLVVYFDAGHSLFAEDGLSHTYAGIGIRLLIDAPNKAR